MACAEFVHHAFLGFIGEPGEGLEREGADGFEVLRIEPWPADGVHEEWERLGEAFAEHGGGEGEGEGLDIGAARDPEGVEGVGLGPGVE